MPLPLILWSFESLLESFGRSGAIYCCTLSLWQVPVTSLAAVPGAWAPPVQYGSGRAGDSDALAAWAWVTCPLLESDLGKSKENTRIASEGEEK